MLQIRPFAAGSPVVVDDHHLVVEFQALCIAVRSQELRGPTTDPSLENRPILQSRHLIRWWREDALAYPALRSIAMEYFTLCVSVTPVDRYFSELKQLTHENQSAETPQTLETRAMGLFGRRTVEIEVNAAAGREVHLLRVLQDEALDIDAQSALVQDIDDAVDDREEEFEIGDVLE